MKRFAKNNKPIKTNGQFDHLIFSSKKHKEDRERGYQLISPKYIRVEIQPKEIPVPWSPFYMERDKAERFADRVSHNFIFSHENDESDTLSPKTVSRDELIRSLKKHHQDASYYWSDSGKRRKDGTKIYQKKKHEGLRDHYFNLPPWISLTLVRALEEPLLIETITCVVNELASRIEQRSGYKVVAAAIHPDSRYKLGFHFCYKTSENGHLLGRSADQKRGRKGLRCMGPSDLALYNMSKVADLVIDLDHRFDRKDWDDKDLSDFADIIFQALLGQEYWDICLNAGKEYVYLWNQLIYKKQYKHLTKQIDDLRIKMAKLEPSNTNLKKDYTPPERLIYPPKKHDVIPKPVTGHKSQTEKRLKEMQEEQDMEAVPKEVNEDISMEM